jgi:hypothetical protein
MHELIEPLHAPVAGYGQLRATRIQLSFCTPKTVHVGAISASGPGRSLIPGLRSRLSKHILAGFMVLSAVGACPPHNGVG